MTPKLKHYYEFENFRFDAERKILWCEGIIVELSPKATEVLSLLIKNHGNLIQREEILQKVWHDAFVEEGNLNNAISALRKGLGGNKIIQTLPRRGYRFTADVREVFDESQTNLIVEKHTLSHTLIDEIEEIEDLNPVFQATSYKRLYQVTAFAVLLLLGGTTLIWFFRGSQQSRISMTPQIKSIAVLPLKSLSDGQALDEQLRLRITDALITKIGRYEGIAVRPTNSVLPFAGEKQDAIEAGEKLKVEAVLDGRVQTENERLRVTLQLIFVETGEQLWSEQFDGNTGRILALQDLISDRLQQRFAFTDANKSKVSQTQNNKAYEAYLKGRFLWNQRTESSYWKALEYFHQAIEADPNFAPAYTGIADCYHLLQQHNLMSPREAFLKAEIVARKALELDPLLAEAHTALASVSFIYHLNYAEAEAGYLRAIELNSNYAEAHARYGMLLNAWGRFDEAFTELKRAEELDPTSLNIAIYLGANFYFSKQFDRAALQFQRILEFSPKTERAHFFLTRIYELSGRYDEAVESSLKERTLSQPQTVETLRSAYQLAGIRGFWQKQIELLKNESSTLYGLDFHIASRFALLGDVEMALEYLEKDLKNRGLMWSYGRVDPSIDFLRSNSRFQEIMRQTSTSN